MTKLRSVDTHFWQDNYISDLDPIEKLLFLYLLTNPLTNMLGIYEIPMKRIAFDTGIDKDMLQKLFARFEEAQKIAYIDGYVVLINFTKHQKYNPNMTKSAIKLYNELPLNLLQNSTIQFIGTFFGIYTKEKEPFETLSNPFKAFGKEEDEIEIESEIESEDESEFEKEIEDENEPKPNAHSPTFENSISENEIQMLEAAIGIVQANELLKNGVNKAAIQRIVNNNNVLPYMTHIDNFLALDTLTQEKDALFYKVPLSRLIGLLNKFGTQLIQDKKIKEYTTYKNFWKHFAAWMKKKEALKS
jgi:hypothetical protein